MQPIETVKYNDYKIEIFHDDTAEDPRKSFEPLGTMVCWHRRRKLGDDHEFSTPADFLELLSGIDSSIMPANLSEEDQVILMLKSITEKYVIQPLYLYDHSGISISTAPFNCRWDSCQIGFIYISRADAAEKFTEGATDEDICKGLKSDVELYCSYISGEVYGYRILDPQGNELDSCWGYYGYDKKTNGIMEAAEGYIEWNIKEAEERRANSIRSHGQLVKQYIKSKLPLIYRQPLSLDK